MDSTTVLSIATTVVVSAFIILMTFMGCLILLTLKKMKDQSNLIWAAGFCLRGLGSVLVVLRGRIDPILSVFVSNTLITWGLALLYSGTSSFLGRGRRPRIVLAFALVSAALVFWIGSSGYTFGLRVALVSLLHALPESAAALMLLIGGAPGPQPSRRATGIVFASCAAALALRACLAIAYPLAENIFEPGPVLALGYGEAILGSVLLAIGFLWMVNARSGSEEAAERRPGGRA